MKMFLAFSLLLSIHAFAGQEDPGPSIIGQEGNGPVLNISMVERKGCLHLAQEIRSGHEDDLLIIEADGETHYLSREALIPKCCAVGLLNCSLFKK